VVTDNKGLSSTPATTQITVWSGVEAPVYNIGGSCDDGNKCTINDNYDASGKCIAGQPLNCDDNDPNTADSCDPAIQSFTAGRVVNQGDTVNIGEGGLNIANAVGGESRISWYDPNSKPGVSNPVKTLYVTPMLTNFYVVPSEFTRYTGTWYQGYTNVVAFHVASGPAIVTGYPATGCVHTPTKPVQPENPAAKPTDVPTPVPTPATDCMKITLPGYYTLQNPITNTDNKRDSCIEITSSGVTFDGNQLKIDGQHTASAAFDALRKGIYVHDSGGKKPSNVVIKNVVVSGWGTGIEFSETDGGSISGCTIDDNKLADVHLANRPPGISLFHAKNTEITNNKITNNDIGILVTSSLENTIGGLPPCQNPDKPTPPSDKKNEISNNNWYGIWLVNSNNNHIIGNTISGSRDNNLYTDPAGIHFLGSKNNEIIFNTISGNYHGNYLEVESTGNNFYKNTMNNNYDEFYVSKDSIGYSTNPVGKTCEVVSQAPLMIAESQVHCTIMGYFTGQCGGGIEWTAIFRILSHVSPQPTPSMGEGTQQELMKVQGAESQNEGILAGFINFPSRTFQGLIGPGAGSQESQTTAKPMEQGGLPSPFICTGNGCLRPVVNSNPGNPISVLSEATISPTITLAANCPGNLSCIYPPCNCECKDLKNDSTNCGACGVSCARGQTCSDGACVSTARTLGECSHGLTNCNGACVNLKSDPANCGTCGLSCPADHPCSGGTCIPEEELRR
jgi:parallel beta-helix repeat protein